MARLRQQCRAVAGATAALQPQLVLVRPRLTSTSWLHAVTSIRRNGLRTRAYGRGPGGLFRAGGLRRPWAARRSMEPQVIPRKRAAADADCGRGRPCPVLLRRSWAPPSRWRDFRPWLCRRRRWCTWGARAARLRSGARVSSLRCAGTCAPSSAGAADRVRLLGSAAQCARDVQLWLEERSVERERRLLRRGERSSPASSEPET